MFQTMPLEMTGPIEVPELKIIRALLLDDSNFDRERIRRLSGKTELAVQLDEVGSIEELDVAVLRASYDLILIDYRLPVGDGMKALSHILDDPMNRDAGKIMITGDAGVETAVQAMRGGCHDFLTKESMNVEVLRAAMLNAMTVARQRLQMQADHQRDIIRQGLVAALNDSEVQEHMASMFREQLARTHSDQAKLISAMDAAEINVLLAGFTDEDEFVFH
tara:strand:+ start:1129 stop:1788 length:660 start_codon:yes stop_codon:yes gene_type:complete